MGGIQAIDQRLSMLQAQAEGRRLEPAEANQATPMRGGVEPDSRVDFGALLQQVIGSMNAAQQHADGLKEAYEAGRINDLATVMLENQKASTAFQGLSAVRNRIVDAYQEINRMPL